MPGIGYNPLCTGEMCCECDDCLGSHKVPTTVTLTMEVGSGFDTEEFGQMLRDALAEYCTNRGPSPESYVTMRYAGSNAYRGTAFRKKVDSVILRTMMARHLMRATISGITKS